MKIYLSIAVSLLLSHALAMPHQEHDEPMQLSELESSMPSETDRLHELFDVVESGLSPNAEGRLLMLTVTKTFVQSATASVTVTDTANSLCYTTASPIQDCSATTTTTTTTTAGTTTAGTTTAGTTTAGTTTAATTTAATTTAATTTAATTTAATTTAAPRKNKNKKSKHHKKNKHQDARTNLSKKYNPFPEAVVTRSDGVPASIFDVLPTPVLDDSEVGRIDTDAFDGVIYDDDSDSTLSSGNLQWRELLVEGMSSCGRSAPNKRPRLLSKVKKTITNTVTMTSTVVAPAKTVTFTLSNIACTTSGFMFGVDEC